MIVAIADCQFASKKALYERLREILWGYPLGSFVSDEDSAFLTAALTSANIYYGYPAEHPVTWRIQQQAMGRCPEFVFLRPDGTRENPSIKRLSLQKKKGGKSARMAARRDVADQIIAFRSSKLSARLTYRCDDCSVTSASAADFEVDHDTPTFIALFQAFLIEVGAAETEISVIERKDETGIMLDFGMAEPFASQWRKFHEANANLQLLCRGCHVHKTFDYNRQEAAPC